MQAYDQAIAHVVNQKIEINLDDGVKINYAKFQAAQEGKNALKVDLLARIYNVDKIGLSEEGGDYFR